MKALTKKRRRPDPIRTKVIEKAAEKFDVSEARIRQTWYYKEDARQEINDWCDAEYNRISEFLNADL